MEFTQFGNKSVLAAFDGGEITTDAGVLLLRETADRLSLFPRMTECFEDHRDQTRVEHLLSDLLSQRVMGIALGYEDLNDHDTLRFDPLLKLAATPKPSRGNAPVSLAGSSTLGRIEQSYETGDRRYHKIFPSLKKLQSLFSSIFIDSYDSPPEQITLDIDATDILTHGHQIGGEYNGYYEERCFLPLYIYCGPHLLLAKLREGNKDPGKGAKEALKIIIQQIKKHWPETKILVRADSGFVRRNLMNWCERNKVDYIFGLARNSYLLEKSERIRGLAAEEIIDASKTTRSFGSFTHTPKSKPWPRPRRVIVKVEHKPGKEQSCRFLVTSLDQNSKLVIHELKKARAELDQKNNEQERRDLQEKLIYENVYCPRGDMENRIKDCQLDLFGDRTSAHEYKANQLRLVLAGFAYVLMTQMRLLALQKTELAKAAPDTIRRKLLKIGAKVTMSVRRIKISMPTAYPYQDIFFQAWKSLAPT